MLRLVILSVCLAVAMATFAPLKTVKERIDGNYIIKIKDGSNARNIIAELNNAPFFELIGGKINREYQRVFNGFSASLSSRALDLIRKTPGVEYVEEDAIFRVQEVASWGLDRIDQDNTVYDEVYSPRYDGDTVHVYVLDTGINPFHEDFEDRAQAAADFASRSDLHQGIDCHGHGTHCSGTVAGKTMGVARRTNIYGVRILSCLGSGSTANIIMGMDFVAQSPNRPAVVSMSLGGGFSQSMNDATANLIGAGVTTVVAAGNSDDDSQFYSPASTPEAITVGASDINDVRASFSNYGALVDVFAPGVSITSAAYDDNTGTLVASGTSMACPHVAGATALVLDQNPDYTPAEVEAQIVNMSIKGILTDVDMADTPNRLLRVKEI